MAQPSLPHPPRLTYRLHELQVSSEFPLPELREVEAAGEPDVVIRRSAALAAPPGDAPPGALLATRPGVLWMEVPGVARYQVRDGREIEVEPLPGADADSVRLFLLGSCVGALMLQRGLLVLHGNAVQVGDGCIVCVGHSGVGKSTLAAALMQRGHRLLTDDVVPVAADGSALPGFPRIKLWQTTADRLGIPTEGLRRIAPGADKFNFPLGDRFADRRLPVRCVYALSAGPQPGVTLEAIHGTARVVPLINNTYRVHYLDGLALRPEHLALCARLASRVRLVRVTRPEEGFELDLLVDALLRDVEAHGG